MRVADVDDGAVRRAVGWRPRPCRQGSARLRRWASASRTGRRASGVARTVLPAVPATATGGCRACSTTIAWISSTITVRVDASIARPESEPSSTYSDSGVVTRMCGGVLRSARALGLRRVAGAHRGADLDIGQALPREFGADAFQRRLQVDVDVVGQRLQRRDVDDLGRVGQAVGRGLRAPARRSRRGTR